jgi:hypothetical protein
VEVAAWLRFRLASIQSAISSNPAGRMGLAVTRALRSQVVNGVVSGGAQPGLLIRHGSACLLVWAIWSKLRRHSGLLWHPILIKAPTA